MYMALYAVPILMNSGGGKPSWRGVALYKRRITARAMTSLSLIINMSVIAASRAYIPRHFAPRSVYNAVNNVEHFRRGVAAWHSRRIRARRGGVCGALQHFPRTSATTRKALQRIAHGVAAAAQYIAFCEKAHIRRAPSGGIYRHFDERPCLR